MRWSFVNLSYDTKVLKSCAYADEMHETQENKQRQKKQELVPLDEALERRTMTSISEISARGSLILWAKFQIPVAPRSDQMQKSSTASISNHGYKASKLFVNRSVRSVSYKTELARWEQEFLQQRKLYWHDYNVILHYCKSVITCVAVNHFKLNDYKPWYWSFIYPDKLIAINQLISHFKAQWGVYSINWKLIKWSLEFISSDTKVSWHNFRTARILDSILEKNTSHKTYCVTVQSVWQEMGFGEAHFSLSPSLPCRKRQIKVALQFV